MDLEIPVKYVGVVVRYTTCYCGDIQYKEGYHESIRGYDKVCERDTIRCRIKPLGLYLFKRLFSGLIF